MTAPFSPVPPCVALVEDADGRWWAMGAPQPPGDIPADEVWDVWDPMSEPIEAWRCIGPCESADHAAQAAAPTLPYDAFDTQPHDEAELEPNDDEWFRRLVARAVRPSAWQPNGPCPLRPPDLPADAPTRAYHVQLPDQRPDILEHGIGRSDADGIGFDVDRATALAQVETNFDDDFLFSDVDEWDLWRIDLTGLPFTLEEEGTMVFVRARVPPEALELEEIVLRPGAPAGARGVARWRRRPRR